MPSQASLNYRLEVIAAASADFQHAIDWYDAIRPQLAAEFKWEVTEIIQSLMENPLIYALASAHVRRAPVHRFPYAVFFEVIEKTVVIIAIFHTSRSPRLWRKRLSGH